MYDHIDIHSHIYFPEFDGDRDEEIKKITEANIATISVGTDFETSTKALEIAEANPNFFACVGQHPGDLDSDSVFDERLFVLAENKKVVAIGETGLDYFRMREDDDLLKTIQKTVFEYHIDLALSVDKPLMLHIRPSKGTQDAYEDALKLLEHHSKTSGGKLRGNAHFFASDLEALKRFLDIGFTVSFNGVLTFTHDYDEFVRYAPLTSIMSETDSPLLAPVPYRGKRNSPLYVSEVVKKIADIREEPLETVKKALVENAMRHFNLIAS